MKCASLAVAALGLWVGMAATALAGDSIVVQVGDVVDGVKLRKIHEIDMNDAGEIAFSAWYGETSDEGRGVFLWEPGTGATSLVIDSGDTVGADTIVTAFGPSLNDAGDVVCVVSLVGGDRALLHYDRSTSTLQIVARRSAPVGGYSLGTGPDGPALNDSGIVFFSAAPGILSLDLASGAGALVVDVGSPVGSTDLDRAISPSVNDLGDLVFVGDWTDTAGRKFGLFSPSGALVVPGDMIDGFTLTNIALPDLADGSGPYFRGAFSGGTGLFSTTEAHLLPGDIVAGRTITGVGRIAVNDGGSVAFTEATSGSNTLFLMESNQVPIADAGPDIQVECTGSSGASLTLDGTDSWDPDGDQLSFEWSVPAASGVVLDDAASATPSGTFPIGPTLVTLAVRDGRGGVAIDDVLITVVDEAPPAAVCTTDLIALWPPNHEYVPVVIDVIASDECTAPEDLVVICTVSSSEADDGGADGVSEGDVDGLDGFAAPVTVTLTYDADLGSWWGEVELRAERNARQATRSYSIVCTVVDVAGNEVVASCVVLVPHDKRGS